jgi:hypothetical protein
MRVCCWIKVVPFWLHFALAALGGMLGMQALSQHEASYAALRQLAAQPAPQIQDIGTLHRQHLADLPQELALAVQVDLSGAQRIAGRSAFGLPQDKMLFSLYAPGDGTETRTVRGAILVSPDEAAIFKGWVETQPKAGEAGQIGPVIALSGLRTIPKNRGDAFVALTEAGFAPADAFVFVQPFWAGRAMGLSVTDQVKAANLVIAFWAAAVFGLLGVLRLIGLIASKKAVREGKLSRFDKACAAPIPAAPAPKPQAVPRQPQASEYPSFCIPPVTAPRGPNDFIGALAAKYASAPAPEPVMASPVRPVRPASSRRMRKLRRMFRFPLAGMAVLAVRLFVLVAFLASVVGLAQQNGYLPFGTADNPQPAPTELVPTPASFEKAVAVTEAGLPIPGREVFLWLWSMVAEHEMLLVMLLSAGLLVSAIAMTLWPSPARNKRIGRDPYDRILQRRLADHGAQSGTDDALRG